MWHNTYLVFRMSVGEGRALASRWSITTITHSRVEMGEDHFRFHYKTTPH